MITRPIGHMSKLKEKTGKSFKFHRREVNDEDVDDLNWLLGCCMFHFVPSIHKSIKSKNEKKRNIVLVDGN